MAGSVYVPDGPRFVATEFARGPWDPDAQHGGAPAALLVRAFERVAGADGLLFARITYEFLRPVPLASLEVRAEAVRSGRRMALLEGSIADGDGRQLVRARALRVRRAETDLPAATSSRPAAPATTPQAASASEFLAWAKRPMFATDAMEIRFTHGHFAERGPAGAWFRLRVPLVADETTSALQRLAATADFGNGISSIVSWENHLFINPDLTLYIEREPDGEWIHLDAETRIAPDGIGMATGALCDQQSSVGRATQALVIQRTR
jgi:Thioesterase-like superfamily